MAVGITSGLASRGAAAASPTPGAGPALFGVHPLQQGRTTLPGGHFNYAMVPGARIGDAVVIDNFAGHAIVFTVYGADLLSASGGGVAPTQPGTNLHEAGAWIAVSDPRVTIAAHSEFADHFTVTLPSGVTPGQHLGAVVASADVGTTERGSLVQARTALMVVVTVPGSAHPAASLGRLGATTSTPGRVHFNVTLSNTGNVLLTYVGSVAVFDGNGREIARLSLTPAGAYVVPSGMVPLAATWLETVLPTGLDRAQATVTIFADGTPVGTLTSQSLDLPLSPASPLPLLTVIMLLGALGAGLLCAGLRR